MLDEKWLLGGGLILEKWFVYYIDIAKEVTDFDYDSLAIRRRGQGGCKSILSEKSARPNLGLWVTL